MIDRDWGTSGLRWSGSCKQQMYFNHLFFWPNFNYLFNERWFGFGKHEKDTRTAEWLCPYLLEFDHKWFFFCLGLGVGVRVCVVVNNLKCLCQHKIYHVIYFIRLKIYIVLTILHKLKNVINVVWKI
jgi:hypothetical protein